MNISFENKCVVVTGGSRGIGKEVVKAFINCKAKNVFAVAHRKEALEELQAEIQALGQGTVVPIHVDLGDWDATQKALQEIGRVDILVNCAGVFVGELFGDVQSDSFDKQFSINVKAMINVSQIVAKKMIECKIPGCIINISSQASQMALQAHTVYSATKAAVDSITRSMASELGEHNIRAVAVNPTVVYTDMGRATWSEEKKAKPLLDRIPLHRFAEVEEVVDVILFLASDKAGMINASTIPIEGGILAT